VVCLSHADENDSTKKIQIFKFKMADVRHIGKHRFGYNSAASCQTFTQISTRLQNPRVVTVACETFQNLQIQDGGRPSF